MKNNIPLTTTFLDIGVLLWLYCIAFIQLANSSNIVITLMSFLFYFILYLCLEKGILPGKMSKFIAIGAFTSTFTTFWANIISLIFFLNNLNGGIHPLTMVGNSILYSLLFLLFYRTTIRIQPLLQVQEQSSKSIRFILEITFPIIAAMSVFIITLSLYSFLSRIQIGLITQESDGINTIITLTAITIIFTVILTFLFENWLSTADNRSMKKVCIAGTIVSVFLTLLIVSTNIR